MPISLTQLRNTASSDTSISVYPHRQHNWKREPTEKEMLLAKNILDIDSTISGQLLYY